MEFENILKLIDSVSNSGLSSFTLEEDGTKIVLEAARGSVTVVEAQGVQAAVQEKAAAAEAVVEPVGKAVKAPLVGVFYAAASPEAAPFVQVGDRVKKGQTIGIIEAMKLMNEVEADMDGVVTEVCVENGAIVEYGQPLIRLL